MYFFPLHHIFQNSGKKQMLLWCIVLSIFVVSTSFETAQILSKWSHDVGHSTTSVHKRNLEMVQASAKPQGGARLEESTRMGQPSWKRSVNIGVAAKQLGRAVSAAEQGRGHEAVASFKSAMVSAGEGARPDIRECNQVLKHLGDHRLLKETKEVYDALVNAKIRMTVVTFCILISRTGAAGRSDYAQFYYREMIAQKIKPDVQVMNSLINAYGKANQLEKVFEVLNEIVKQGLVPTVVTFNSVCEACCRANNLDRARKVIAFMRKHQMTPNVRTQSILINGLAKAGKVHEALEVFRGMKEEDSPPANEFIYATLINACGKSEMLETAMELYQEMRFERKLTPNVVVWTALMDACVRGSQLSVAFSLLKEMMSCGVNPNEVTLSTLFHGCLKEREIDMAFQVLDLMKEEGMDMQVAYTCLLSECTDMDDEKASLHILHRLASNKTHYSEVPFQDTVGTKMLDLLAKTKELDKAFDVFETMVQTQVFPSDETLQAVIEAVDSAKELDQALEVLADMRKQGKKVNEVTYIALLGACGRTDRLLKAFLLLQDMKSSGQQPSENFYHSLMEICEESNTPNVALDVFEVMENSGVQPGLQSFKSLLKAITKDQDVPQQQISKDEPGAQPVPQATSNKSAVNGVNTPAADNLFRVFLVFQEMRSRGIEPDRPAYNCILSACSKAGNLEKAWQVYQQMIEDGISLDAISYTNLIKACSVGGEITQAEDIFQTMQQRTNHFSTYVQPTEVTYATIMQANNKCKRYSRVLQLYDEMKYNKIRPCLFGYREALKACYKLKDKDHALKVYAQMKKNGHRPDNQCLLSIVKLLDNRGEHNLSRKIRMERSMVELWSK